MVQNSWGVDDLPPKVLVVHMSDKERFGGESVLPSKYKPGDRVSKRGTHWLNVDIGSGDLVDETTLSDIWVTTDQECSGVWVDGRQT